MAGSNWENFGEEIRKTVQDAVENQDYHKLNQTVTETLDRAMGAAINSASQGMKNARNGQKNGPVNTQNSGGGAYGRTVGSTYRQSQPAQRGNAEVWRQNSALPALYKSTSGAKAGGLLLSIGGGIFGVMFGYPAISLLLAMILSNGPAEYWVVALILGILTATGFGVMGLGLARLKREKRFKMIVQGIGNRQYCDVKEVAAMIGVSEKKAVRELTKMMISGWFCQGHFDESKKCLITSEQMYQEYMQLNAQRKRQAAQLEEKRQKEVKRAEDVNSKLSPEARQVIETGDAFVRKIRACNDAIPGERISAKISHMEMIVDRIFDRVEQNPETISDIRKLMDYYLPTTIKLLEAYQELDAQPVAGENIQSSKREIEATLDTLNAAFEKILDDLFHRTAWDVSSDISVLNTVLAQEGLKDDGIKLQ